MRRRCVHCDHAETTFEVTAQQMAEYELLLRLKTSISQVLNPDACESSDLCTSCSYWSNGSCSMQFPEAGGSFASECSCYSPPEHEGVSLVRERHEESCDLRGVLSKNARW